MNFKQSYTAESIQAFLVSHLAEVLGVETAEIDVHENLENYGLDSAQAMIIISKLEELLGFKPSPILLWHYPNIAALSQRLSEESSDNCQVKDVNLGANFSVNFAPPFLDLAAEAVLDPTIQPVGNTVFISHPKNIFLTGGTGYLGAFIIKELLEVSEAILYCLVRASNVEEGKSKLENNLQQYGIWQDKYSHRIIPIIGDLSQPHLEIGRAHV